MDAFEIRRTAAEVRERAAALADGKARAESETRYIAAQLSLLALAVEELAKELDDKS